MSAIAFRSSLRRSIWLLGLATVAIVGILAAELQLTTASQALKFFALLLAAPVLVLAAIKPEAGVVIVAVVLPLDVQTSLFSAQVRLSDEIIVAFALVLMWRIRPAALPRAMWLGVALFIFGAAAAVGASPDKGVALGGAVKYLASGIIGIASIQTLSKRPALRRLTATAIVAGGLVTAAFGTAQVAGLPLVGAPYSPGVPNGFLQYYTTYAGFLALVAIIALGLAIHSRGFRRWPYAVAALLLIVAVVGSTSRGAAAALGVGIVAAAALLWRASRRRFTAAVGAVLGMLALGAVVVSQGTGLVSRLADTTLTSGGDAERTRVQGIAWNVAGSHPLGIGYGNFVPFQPTDISSQGPFFHGHEAFAQVLLDVGWIGGAGVLLMVVVVALRSTTTRDALAIAGGACLAAAAVQGLNDYLFYDTPSLSLLALCIALAMTGQAELTPRAGDPTSNQAVKLRAPEKGRHRRHWNQRYGLGTR